MAWHRKDHASEIAPGRRDHFSEIWGPVFLYESRPDGISGTAESPRMRREDSPVDLGTCWLSKRPNSRMWCAAWYPGNGNTPRLESLRTPKETVAQERLIMWAAKRLNVKNAPPETVPMRDVLVWYHETHALKSTRSHEAAALAFRLLLNHLPNGASANAFTRAEQVQFVDELGKQGRSTSYIRRILNPIKAALNRREARKDHRPPICRSQPCARRECTGTRSNDR